MNDDSSVFVINTHLLQFFNIYIYIYIYTNIHSILAFALDNGSMFLIM